MAYTAFARSAPAAGGIESALSSRVRVEGMHRVVVLRGEADFSTTSVLCGVLARVIALPDGDVVVDLAELAFIDTAAVRALAVGQRLLGRRGRGMALRSPSRLVARVLDYGGLSGLVEGGEGAQR